MSVAIFYHRDSATVQNAVTKLYRCLVEIKMKAEFKNEKRVCLSKGAGSRGVGSREGDIAFPLNALARIGVVRSHRKMMSSVTGLLFSALPTTNTRLVFLNISMYSSQIY